MTWWLGLTILQALAMEAVVMSVVVAYLLFAPDLYRISRKHQFVTPGDWIQHRFNSPALTLTASLLFVVAIANYLLAQLTAMGHVVAGLSGNVNSVRLSCAVGFASVVGKLIPGRAGIRACL